MLRQGRWTSIQSIDSFFRRPPGQLISAGQDQHRIGIVCLPDVRATCRTVPGLTREQLELCYRASDVTAAAIEGLELGVRECQHQFQWHRWNCSSLSTRSRNPHTSSMLKRGMF
ncbi:protein Wnt-10a-like [Uranotaenia lowii]|uniref:protein Wnt-10a-like n=1 Tax=Uranotaenia lowii TaxID=190385 RepID=UPI002479B63D|nr:protein Wnt-10a-like [Uranotaenia lowii]